MRRKRVRGIIFGPQGSGKSTQGHLLAEWFDIPFIGSGELLRQEIQEKTSLGMLVEQYVAHGMLAPDELVNAIIKKRLKDLDMEGGFLLDGYPRNIEQAEDLDKHLSIDLAIHLKMTDAIALRRLLGRLYCPACRSVFHELESPPAIPGICSVCGGPLKRRDDDQEETIRHRLMAYRFMTEPMTTYYRQRGVLLSVNADQPIPFLFQELIKKMAKLGFTNVP